MWELSPEARTDELAAVQELLLASGAVHCQAKIGVRELFLLLQIGSPFCR